MKKNNIAIIGGDKRTAYMAPLLAKEGFQIACFHTVYDFSNQNTTFPHSFDTTTRNRIRTVSSLQEAVEGAHIIICGIPFSQNGYLSFKETQEKIPLAELQRCLRKKQHVFGGVLPDSFRRHCEEREIICHDFMADEALALFNAIATTEGAILEALLHKDTNLHDSKVLVLGYGRCGKVLADKLKGLSAQVTVCSRNSLELALAYSLGMETLPLSGLLSALNQYEYIFNTIPANLFEPEHLQQIHPDAIVIDIASGQGCMNTELSKDFHFQFNRCPGLPGKYAGFSSAVRLTSYVLTHYR